MSRTVKSQCKNVFNYLDIYQLVECNHHLSSFSPVLRQTRLPTGELSKIDVDVGDQVDRWSIKSIKMWATSLQGDQVDRWSIKSIKIWATSLQGDQVDRWSIKSIKMWATSLQGDQVDRWSIKSIKIWATSLQGDHVDAGDQLDRSALKLIDQRYRAIKLIACATVALLEMFFEDLTLVRLRWTATFFVCVWDFLHHFAAHSRYVAIRRHTHLGQRHTVLVDTISVLTYRGE